MQLLLTQALRQQLPKLGHGDESGLGLEAKAIAKFFMSNGRWVWYASEFDGEDLFYGFVFGNVPELGYFRLSELEQVRGRHGLPVERDGSFTPLTLHQVMALHPFYF